MTEKAQVTELTPTQAQAALQDRPEIKLLDVRAANEFEYVRLEHALLVTNELAKEILESWPKDAEIICYCHHGIRSYQAACALIEKGFTNVGNIVGGIDAWALTVDQSLPRY